VDEIGRPRRQRKVPINPGYILYHDNEKIVIRNYEGKILEAEEGANGKTRVIQSYVYASFVYGHRDRSNRCDTHLPPPNGNGESL
jgi:hypothetical protein